MAVNHPPLRKWRVRTMPILTEDGSFLQTTQEEDIVAHLVFDNSNRGEGLCFRRYIDGDVKTYIVALFAPGTWQNFKEIPNG